MKQQGWVLLAMALVVPIGALAQSGHANGNTQPFWLGVGVGGAAVNSLQPAPSAGRDALAASIELGYRLTPEWGMGLEYGGVLPLSGCAQWQCGQSRADFAPNFTRLFAFGEYRTGESGLSVRGGFGVSRFCYQRHWSEHAWSWIDTLDLLLSDDDYYSNDRGSGAWRCDAAGKALGAAVSLGYDWPVARNSVSMGVRLTAEAANFAGAPAAELPSFRHRAVSLTLHLNLH